MTAEELIQVLRRNANPANVAGMARYGISTRNTLGVSIPFMRQLARAHRRQHELALALWASEIHEARILATLVDDPQQVTARQMEAWVKELDSWDTCDQLCNNLFRRTAHARAKALAWSGRKGEFVRRAGFVLMACLAVHDKAATDRDFEPFFAALCAGATDERNFVRKAVNWALRQIGKRNPALRRRAIAVAREIAALDTKAARWIAADALRELSA
jgi:3-methyladenine DNA glycosylase AlkD